MEIELGASKKEETGSKRNGIGRKARVITSVSIHLYFCFIFSPLPANFEREKTKFKPSQAETKWKKKYIFWDDIKVLYIGTTLFQFFFFWLYILFLPSLLYPIGSTIFLPFLFERLFPFSYLPPRYPSFPFHMTDFSACFLLACILHSLLSSALLIFVCLDVKRCDDTC